MLSPLVLAVLAPLVLASPGPVPIQGLVHSADGAPIQGTRDVTVALWNDETGGTAWSSTAPVTFVDGAFATMLQVDLDRFAADPSQWLSIQLVGDAPSERVPVGFAPVAGYALRAGDAATVGQLAPAALVQRSQTGAGLAWSGDTVAVDATWAAAPWVRRDGVGAGLTLTGSTLTVDATWTGAPWVTTSGLTAAMSGLTPALGATTTIGGQAVGAFVDAAKSPVLLSPAASASVPVGEAAFTWTAVPGATSYTVQVDDDPAFGSPNATASTSGTSASIGNLAVGSYQWRVVPAGNGGAATAGRAIVISMPRSCRRLYLSGVATTNGNYTVDPDGPGGNAAFIANCDMTGGGWTAGYSTWDSATITAAGGGSTTALSNGDRNFGITGGSSCTGSVTGKDTVYGAFEVSASLSYLWGWAELLVSTPARFNGSGVYQGCDATCLADSVRVMNNSSNNLMYMQMVINGTGLASTTAGKSAGTFKITRDTNDFVRISHDDTLYASLGILRGPLRVHARGQCNNSGGGTTSTGNLTVRWLGE
jgi:hypothetical protein